MESNLFVLNACRRQRASTPDPRRADCTRMTGSPLSPAQRSFPSSWMLTFPRMCSGKSVPTATRRFTSVTHTWAWTRGAALWRTLDQSQAFKKAGRGGVAFRVSALCPKVLEKGRLRKKNSRCRTRKVIHGRFLRSENFWLQNCATQRNAVRMQNDRNT